MIKKIILFLILVVFTYPNVSANYTRNIDDDLLIYKLDQKIGNIIEKSKNKVLLKEKLLNRIEKKLGKGNQEINKINIRNYELKSFKEYALIKLHKYLSYGDLLRYKDSKVKVLENNFVRILVTLPDIQIDNNSVYYIHKKSGTKIKYIEFFKINSNENTEDFINTKILEEKYKGKCNVYIKSENGNFWTKNQIFGIGAYGDYKSTELREISDCGLYGSYYGINYFERISPTILIYINAGQDYNGVDFSLIETKY